MFELRTIKGNVRYKPKNGVYYYKNYSLLFHHIVRTYQLSSN